MDIKPEEMSDLLEYFSKNTYRAKETHPKSLHVMKRCLDLFAIDYDYKIVPNSAGDLSTNYPSSLVILEGEKLDPCGADSKPTVKLNPEQNGETGENEEADANYLDIGKLKEMCGKARFARCRARFPVPVILYNKKHVCRSATLSGGPEIYGRSSFDYLFSSSGVTDPTKLTDIEGDDDFVVSETQSEWQLFDRVRSQDIRLLKTFQVQTIVDLMVEKKKVKFGVNVTSSEKVDKEKRYADFNIISLPYPGCEFFKQYRDNSYNAEDLVFEWNQGHVDATIFVPSDPITASLKVDWSHYRSWDLVTLTQNYLKLLLVYLKDSSDGMLIHCISGWDRTPLFISLLRLSLWADGAIHKSLDAKQILYLTLAYDWLLFGHNLQDRLSKGEEILSFCFNFLKYMVDSDFSVLEKREREREREREPPKQQFSRVRNDSDIHLEGVLLEGELNPEGSNWSISSSTSSQSSKSKGSNNSQENPPTYFQVAHDQDSWDDFPGAHHLMNRHQTSNHSIAQNQNNHHAMLGRHNAPDYSNSNGNSKGGTNGQAHSSQSSRASPSQSCTVSGNASSSYSSSNGNGAGSRLHGRTSPVAVPVPNSRNIHHARPDSNSSASIGSWQLITGTGSLRETISTSDPGSGSSHSHPSRLPVNSGLDCIEASESSCTLVEELTPVESKPHLSSKSTSPNGQELKGWKVYEREDEETVRRNDNVFFPTSSIDKPVAPTLTTPAAAPTPLTPLSLIKPTNSNMTKRHERLQTVRAHFYNFYSSVVGFQPRSSGNDNGSSGGLGFLIGNFATKVGIRAPHRNNV